MNNKKPKIIVGSNICLTCKKVIYIPKEDIFILIDDMPIIECPVCKTKDKVVVVTKINSEEIFGLYN